jgi:hypothetical protein
MKTIVNLHRSVWMSLKKWVSETFRKENDDDNGPFDTPFAIL